MENIEYIVHDTLAHHQSLNKLLQTYKLIKSPRFFPIQIKSEYMNEILTIDTERLNLS